LCGHDSAADGQVSDVSANGTRLLEALPEEATQTALPRLILALLQTYEGPCPRPPPGPRGA
jgi:hypothetical protein